MNHHQSIKSHTSLQSRRNFGGRVLSIFFTKIMAAIFDFMAAEGWGRTTIKNKERGRGVKITSRPPPASYLHPPL